MIRRHVDEIGNYVTMRLTGAFGRLTADERVQLEPLREWLLSDDKADRFDAIAIVRDNDVTSMIPTLRELQDRLEESTEIGARYEWAKVNRALGRLVSVSDIASDLTSESETSGRRERTSVRGEFIGSSRLG